MKVAVVITVKQDRCQELFSWRLFFEEPPAFSPEDALHPKGPHLCDGGLHRLKEIDLALLAGAGAVEPQPRTMARMMAQHDTNGTMVRMVRWRAWRTGWTGLGWMDGMDGLHGWAGWMDGWAGWAGLTCRAVDTANVGWMDGWGLGVQATSVSDSNP